jgi:limonene-1,2-epoxide hydrolase
MTRSADELITEFCAKWSTPDPGELASYFAEDGVFHNMPMDAVQGREAIKQFIAGFLAAFDFDGVDFLVHRQINEGNLVMNERTDVMRRKGSEPIRLPVTGVFEIENGQIKAWRDYFDMATVTNAMS